ncbi:FtsW/RodA/SpoVE family cell cycle protein [Candidatus Dojkabacteria bacterium]|nr:FtsW/RodA/SpoVE family cell cycle protein [Candidatus Dojkabacteria bacterium]
MLIYSTTINASTESEGAGTFSKQLFFFIVGFLIYFAFSTFDLSWLKNKRLIGLLYVITILALLYVKFFTPEVANTNRWINLFGFNIQPAEYAKITIIIITAMFFGLKDEPMVSKNVNLEKLSGSESTHNHKEKYLAALQRIKLFFQTYENLILSILSIAVISFLIFVQPSFGNSVIITFLWASLVFAASSNQHKLISLSIPIIIIPLLGWNIWGLKDIFGSIYIGLSVILLATIVLNIITRVRLYFLILAILIGLSLRPFILTIWDTNIISDYQKQRIQTYFQSPENDPLDAGYQVRQSKIAVGSGQLQGRGYLQGTQSTLKVLPFAHTDFIFAALAEQFGFVGSLLLLGIYSVIIYRIVRTGISTKDEFSFLIATGVISLLILNIFINIGMNLGKLPVTGVPLPLLSYGGSSVLVNMIALGLIQSINTTRTSKDISESLLPSSSPWR